MNRFDLQSDAHHRLNPLTGEWVLVSPHRTARPWQGQVELARTDEVPRFDPDCYMCPGNHRAKGDRNPAYTSTFVFDNDFTAMTPDGRTDRLDDGDLLVARGEPGICRVMCFSPRHDLTLARLPQHGVREIVDVWVAQLEELGRAPQVGYVQIFENRGAMMGASNPHPHCQIWANTMLPNEPGKEHGAQQAYFDRRRRDLLGAYLDRETELCERVVCGNEHFVALVPFWATWPFELMVLPVRHAAGLDELTPDERGSLADLLRRVTTKYDNLFQTPFPYSMGFHQRPTDGAPHPEWRWHAHFYPPLVRSATIRKFMVGYEMLCTPQRDTTPEHAAERLRACSEVHYRNERTSPLPGA